MVVCRLCERSVRALHPVPPEIITKDLLEALTHGESAADVEICAECIELAMEGQALPGTPASEP